MGEFSDFKMEDIKIIGVETAVDRTKKNYISLVKFSNGCGNLEVEVESNQPFWAGSGGLEFADSIASGSNFRVTGKEVSCALSSG